MCVFLFTFVFFLVGVFVFSFVIVFFLVGVFVFTFVLQSLTVPKILSDTDTDTFFRYQIFTIPIPVIFYGTKIFRYWFRDFFLYHFFPIPREKLTIPVTHHNYLSQKFWQ